MQCLLGNVGTRIKRLSPTRDTVDVLCADLVNLSTDNSAILVMTLGIRDCQLPISEDDTSKCITTKSQRDILKAY